MLCQNGKKITADFVIVSVPLGALKSNAIKFIPELPEFKKQAIQKMGVGNFCKVLIELPEQAVTSKHHYICVVSDNV